MIVRNSGDSLLLITQPDHAHLAGTLADAGSKRTPTRGAPPLPTCSMNARMPLSSGRPRLHYTDARRRSPPRAARGSS